MPPPARSTASGAASTNSLTGIDPADRPATAIGQFRGPRMDSPLMQGFPSLTDRQVTLANWLRPPFNRWSFQHVREILPTACIDRPRAPVTPLWRSDRPVEPVAFQSPHGSEWTVGRLLAETFTNGFMVLQRGRVVAERYDNGLALERRHIVFSVSKSITASLAGVLVGPALRPAAQRASLAAYGRGVRRRSRCRPPGRGARSRRHLRKPARSSSLRRDDAQGRHGRRPPGDPEPVDRRHSKSGRCRRLAGGRGDAIAPPGALPQQMVHDRQRP